MIITYIDLTIYNVDKTSQDDYKIKDVPRISIIVLRFSWINQTKSKVKVERKEKKKEKLLRITYI